MNKKVLKVAFVAAIAMVSAINVFNAQKTEMLSDVALANVEALADAESNLQDFITNCTWQESSYCHYLVVTPDGNTAWSHWNMRNY